MAITKKLSLVLIGIALASTSYPSSAQELEVRGPHPRLFLTAERIAKLQERIKKESTTAEAWAKILADPKTIEELCLAYRMTGEKHFADKVKGKVRGLRYGDNALMKRNPPWHAGLGTARSCYESAVAYDSIYDAMNPAERVEMAKGMIEKGILPTLNDWVLGKNRIHALDSMGHNWWSACVFGAGMASLAVMDEEPRAEDWLNRISDGSVEWFEFAGSLLDNKPKSFDAEGAFYEDVPPGKSRRTKFVTAVTLVNEANKSNLPQIKSFEGTNYIGVSVNQGGSTTDVYLNLRADGSIMHRNGNLIVNGWETDAYLTAITFPNGPDETASDRTDPDRASRYFIAQGSYLRRDETSVLDSLSKLFLVSERTGSDHNVLLQGQPVMNAYLRSLVPAKTLKLNGVSRDPAYDVDTKMLKLSTRK